MDYVRSNLIICIYILCEKCLEAEVYSLTVEVVVLYFRKIFDKTLHLWITEELFGFRITGEMQLIYKYHLCDRTVMKWR